MRTIRRTNEFRLANDEALSTLRVRQVASHTVLGGVEACSRSQSAAIKRARIQPFVNHRTRARARGLRMKTLAGSRQKGTIRHLKDPRYRCRIASLTGRGRERTSFIKGFNAPDESASRVRSPRAPPPHNYVSMLYGNDVTNACALALGCFQTL